MSAKVASPDAAKLSRPEPAIADRPRVRDRILETACELFYRHGIRAVEDPAVLSEIVDRGLVLDVCPTSNVRTACVPSLADHPLPDLRYAGVPCTINTDDPAMFGTDLGREYEVAAGLGVTPAEAFEAGVTGALCDDETRARLASIGRAAFAAA